MINLLEEKQFRESLLEWWSINKRTFPWRRTKDPYKILVAEVMLHRTKADQVVPIYKNFLQRFSEPRILAQASEKEVYAILKPLGLYWRVPLLLLMAKDIVNVYSGIIPKEKKALQSLPGVSEYISGAVRSFAFNVPDPILDTNTVRVMGRIHDLPITDGSRRNKQFREEYKRLMDNNKPREFNFAMIDLAALLCKPHFPVCHRCPVQKFCLYGNEKANLI